MVALQQAYPGHGMTEVEAAIMDRYDEGALVGEIACKLRLGERRVQSVIDMFREGRSDDWEEPVRNSSRALLASVRRLQARSATSTSTSDFPA